MLRLAFCVSLASLVASVSPALERLGRGLVAIECERGVFLSWRLLATDFKNVRFHVFRREENSPWQRLTNEPLTATNFTDTQVVQGKTYRYQVRTLGNIVHSKEIAVTVTGKPKPYLAIPLQGKYRAQKVAIADLNGDGEFDFVIKQPDFNVDPYQAPGYWRPSPDTFKLEAYLSDGTFLWRHDLGWSIELGIWYSPYVAYDVDSDGKAEVLTKAGEGDPREPTGHVMKGPEWLLMLDGMKGKEKRKTPWISREGYEDYNLASR
ncbi:MAG: silent information regulator protein Sir2, partial [Armatimonadetes bacterium]|nr:silent information regulator protein Sir2 [Armatimonadota bacterium]